MTRPCQHTDWAIVCVYDAIMVIQCLCGRRRVYERHYDQMVSNEDKDARDSAAAHRRATEERD